jgi:hypothetical protein
MSNNYDTFTDVINSVNGVFEGAAGLKSHDSVKTHITQGGCALVFECQGCGAPTQLLVEYPELVAMKYGVNPAIAFRGTRFVKQPMSWMYLPHENAWRPHHLECVKCGFKLPIRIERGECERHLSDARSRGFINPAGEKDVSQRCMEMARAGQSVRQHP